MLLEVGACILLFYCIWFIWENWVELSENSPPGPRRIPPFGTLIQIGMANRTGHLALDKLSKVYGDVMSVKFGLMNTVILSSYKAVKEVFNRDEVLDRPTEGIWWERCKKQNIGLVFSNGENWKEMRRFSKEALGRYGFGKRGKMEELIRDEIKNLLEYMDDQRVAQSGRIHISVEYFNISFVNLMSSMATGEIHEYDDPDLLRLLKHSVDFMKNGAFGTGLLTAYPFLRFLIPGVLGYSAQVKALQGIMEYVQNVFETRKQHDYTNNPECFTDEFLKKMDEDRGNPFPLFTKDQFLVLLADIMQSGSETSSNVISFILLQLSCHPEIQTKLYEEILAVCGGEQQPSLNDKPKMPYTQAVILEGYRWARTVVLGAPKLATQDLSYLTYKIKKGTVLFMNIHTIFFDRKFWGDPEVFRPERFLDKNDNLIHSKAERISIAFGVGKRNCFGEVMARDSTFLFTTGLIQRFAFRRPENEPNPDLEPMPGLSNGPRPYDIILESR